MESHWISFCGPLFVHMRSIWGGMGGGGGGGGLNRRGFYNPQDKPAYCLGNSDVRADIGD